MVGALPHLLARGLAHFIGAVGDGGFELQAVAADAFAAHVGAPAAESEWPPVGPIDWPAMKTRGPTICPVSIAVLMPQSAPPVSRTVVKPRSSMARNRVAARAVSSVSGIASMKRTLTSLWMACTWQSISPGISVRLPQSIDHRRRSP